MMNFIMLSEFIFIVCQIKNVLMKRLSKIKLNAPTVLNDQEMKLVLGGSAYSGGDGICAWTPYDRPDLPIVGCSNSASRAEEGAGTKGWWCCNCNAAIAHCASKL